MRLETDILSEFCDIKRLLFNMLSPVFNNSHLRFHIHFLLSCLFAFKKIRRY